jgi:hypothetical protein
MDYYFYIISVPSVKITNAILVLVNYASTQITITSYIVAKEYPTLNPVFLEFC